MPGGYSDGYSDGYGPIAATVTATDILQLPIDCVIAGDQPDITPSIAFKDIVARKYTEKVVLAGSGVKHLAGSSSFTSSTGSLRRS